MAICRRNELDLNYLTGLPAGISRKTGRQSEETAALIAKKANTLPNE
jgi:hypothetical protein